MENYSMKSKDEINKQLFDKFDDVLFSLDAELNPVEASLAKQEIYRHLSEQYVASPKKFTEKLITIIEESVVNSTVNMSNNSIINFKKISKELQKMCGNLENESMPEELLCTTISSSPSKEISKIIIDDNSPKITTGSCLELPSTLTLNANSCTIKTPSSSIMSKKVYRKTPRSIFKSEMKKKDETIPLSPSTYNNMSFEYLEAYCERLFPNEKKDRTSVQTIQDNTLLSMDHVFTICEQQLASLNSTSDDINVNSHKKNDNSIKELHMQSKDVQSKDPISHEGEDRDKKLKKVDDERCKVNLDSEFIHCTDELDKTLLSEILEKRRRCLDTAKKMLEINSECNKMEVEKESKADCKSTLDVNSNKPQNDNANFLNMLISCKDYHNFLENQLPMLNASASSKTLRISEDINKTNKRNINIDLIPNKKKKCTDQQSNSKSRCSKSYIENYRKILARWNIDNGNKEGKTEKAMYKPKFFTTPGKISTKNKHVRRVFFADVGTSKKQRSSLSSPHLKSPQRKVSRVNITHTPSTSYLIRRNLSTLRKCGTDKNKENKVN